MNVGKNHAQNILTSKILFYFSQIFWLFSKPSTVCVDKALEEKFTYTAEN